MKGAAFLIGRRLRWGFSNILLKGSWPLQPSPVLTLEIQMSLPALWFFLGDSLLHRISCFSLYYWGVLLSTYSLGIYEEKACIYLISVLFACFFLGARFPFSLALKEISSSKGSNDASLRNFLFSDSSQFHLTWANVLEIWLSICIAFYSFHK